QVGARVSDIDLGTFRHLRKWIHAYLRVLLLLALRVASRRLSLCSCERTKENQRQKSSQEPLRHSLVFFAMEESGMIQEIRLHDGFIRRINRENFASRVTDSLPCN